MSDIKKEIQQNLITINQGNIQSSHYGSIIHRPHISNDIDNSNQEAEDASTSYFINNVVANVHDNEIVLTDGELSVTGNIDGGYSIIQVQAGNAISDEAISSYTRISKFNYRPDNSRTNWIRSRYIQYEHSSRRDLQY